MNLQRILNYSSLVTYADQYYHKQEHQNVWQELMDISCEINTCRSVYVEETIHTIVYSEGQFSYTNMRNNSVR